MFGFKTFKNYYNTWYIIFSVNNFHVFIKWNTNIPFLVGIVFPEPCISKQWTLLSW